MEERRKPKKGRQQSKDSPNNASKLVQPLQSGWNKGHDAFGRAWKEPWRLGITTIQADIGRILLCSLTIMCAKFPIITDSAHLLHLSKHWSSSHIWSIEILCNSFAINQPKPLFCFLGLHIPHHCPALRSAIRQGVRRPRFSSQQAVTRIRVWLLHTPSMRAANKRDKSHGRTRARGWLQIGKSFKCRHYHYHHGEFLFHGIFALMS